MFLHSGFYFRASDRSVWYLLFMTLDCQIFGELIGHYRDSQANLQPMAARGARLLEKEKNEAKQ